MENMINSAVYDIPTTGSLTGALVLGLFVVTVLVRCIGSGSRGGFRY